MSRMTSGPVRMAATARGPHALPALPRLALTPRTAPVDDQAQKSFPPSLPLHLVSRSVGLNACLMTRMTTPLQRKRDGTSTGHKLLLHRLLRQPMQPEDVECQLAAKIQSPPQARGSSTCVPQFLLCLRMPPELMEFLPLLHSVNPHSKGAFQVQRRSQNGVRQLEPYGISPTTLICSNPTDPLPPPIILLVIRQSHQTSKLIGARVPHPTATILFFSTNQRCLVNLLQPSCSNSYSSSSNHIMLRSNNTINSCHSNSSILYYT